MTQFQVYVVGDSRLKDMEPKFKLELTLLEVHDININILSFPGATIREIIDSTLNLTRRKSIELLYLSGGIINQTTKLGYRNIIPKYNTMQDMADHVEGELELGKLKLEVVSKMVILCELICLAFNTYNLSGKSFYGKQTSLNHEILDINKRIELSNTRNNIDSTTHKMRHGRMGHRYAGILWDGLHYTNKPKQKIAHNIVYTMYPNIYVTCN